MGLLQRRLYAVGRDRAARAPVREPHGALARAMSRIVRGRSRPIARTRAALAGRRAFRGGAHARRRRHDAALLPPGVATAPTGATPRLVCAPGGAHGSLARDRAAARRARSLL